ncbi:hypothetical protein JOE65_000380 [Arthrobacter roseus]|nr:hypothetical protein [Arthrobacter roseus]
MTLGQPSGRQPTTFDGPVHGHCFECVRRARREKAADRTIKRRNDLAIYRKETHDHKPWTSVDKSQSSDHGRREESSHPVHGTFLSSKRLTTLDKALLKSASISVHSASAAGGNARTTTSTPLATFAKDKAAHSRSLLLTTLRATAFPTALDTMNPKRLGSADSLAAAYTTTFRRP